VDADSSQRPLENEHQGASTQELMSRLSEQSTRLIHDELSLARVELSEKAKQVGLGAGLFSTAGLLALFGLGTLIAAAVLGLAEAVPAWLSALIVALVIFAAAGVAALLGKRKVDEGTPPIPERTLENVKRDVAEVKEARSRDNSR
jgi:uncharacterized membrane protein YqjE